MKNRNKTYAKMMLALAIGFSLSAEAMNYALNLNKTVSEKPVTEKTVQKQADVKEYRGNLSFWE